MCRWNCAAPGRDLLKRMWPVYAAAIQRHIGAKLKRPAAAQLATLLTTLQTDPPA